MFTGIVEEPGRVVAAKEDAGNLRVTIETAVVADDLALGDSVAVGGCCLTVVRVDGKRFDVELSKESVAKTSPRWEAGKRVNLERAMSAASRFGGHIVTGHVEGVGEVLDVQENPGAYVITVRAPEHMGRYLIPKGSITVDGVSLTVVDVGGPGGTREDWEAGRFTLWIIPHTLEVTTLGELQRGSKVNLEADVLARHLERLLLMRETGEPAAEVALSLQGAGRVS